MLDVRRFMLATAEPVHGKGGFDIPHAFEKFPGVCRPLRHRLVIFKWRASALSAHQIFGTRPASAKATARLGRVSLQLWNLSLVANIRRTYRPLSGSTRGSMRSPEFVRSSVMVRQRSQVREFDKGHRRIPAQSGAPFSLKKSVTTAYPLR